MIQKYSLVELLDEKKFDYVQEVIDGRLKLTGSTEPIENDPKKVKEVFPDDLTTDKIIAVYKQLKLLKEIYGKEIQRRSTDVQKNKTKSKYFNDDFKF